MDDHALWEAFTAATLPASEWTHRAHLRVAWLFLRRHRFDEAHLLMRVGIIRLNAFHGLVETPARGYHETLTRLWLALVAALVPTIAAEDSATFIASALPRLGKDAALRHYSQELLMSVRARTVFVAPDREPWPLAVE